MTDLPWFGTKSLEYVVGILGLGTKNLECVVGILGLGTKNLEYVVGILGLGTKNLEYVVGIHGNQAYGFNGVRNAMQLLGHKFAPRPI